MGKNYTLLEKRELFNVSYLNEDFLIRSLNFTFEFVENFFFQLLVFKLTTDFEL